VKETKGKRSDNLLILQTRLKTCIGSLLQKTNKQTNKQKKKQKKATQTYRLKLLIPILLPEDISSTAGAFLLPTKRFSTLQFYFQVP